MGASATTTELFNCSVEEFFEIVKDYEKYPEFLSEVKSCRIIDEQAGRKLVEYEVNVVKTFKYTLWMEEHPHETIKWDLSGGDIFKGNHGSWNLVDEAGKCRATYDVECDFKGFVPGPISKALVQVNLPNMMSAYHKRVSEVYGK